jgi:triacylglycerol esterase/lipase EstA (alpha/beta hydrolase family)
MARFARGIAVALVVTAGITNAAESGPALSVPIARLDDALSCPPLGSDRRPVLLVHGTAVTAEEHWGWNYADVLPELGYDVCLVRLPDRAMSDIQIASEYVVNAIRRMFAAAGRKIAVIGHSQGTLEPRWALRWWPEAGEAVDDSISLAGPHHGTSSADGACAAGSCFPAAWQMSRGSAFLDALNSADETPGDVSYTSLYSQTDELVQPPETAILEGAANFSIQDLCPLRPIHHVGLNEDAVVFALVLDALEHEGPADPGRIDIAALCGETLMPGVNAIDAVAGNALVYGNGALTVATHEQVAEEPPLAPYATGP